MLLSCEVAPLERFDCMRLRNLERLSSSLMSIWAIAMSTRATLVARRGHANVVFSGGEADARARCDEASSSSIAAALATACGVDA